MVLSHGALYKSLHFFSAAMIVYSPAMSDRPVNPASDFAPSRLLVLGLGVLLAAGVIGFYGREATSLLGAVIAVELLVQLGYWAVCFLLGRVALRRLAAAHLNSAVGIASSAAIGFALIGFASLALGLAGWLGAHSAWAIMVAAGGVGLWDAREVGVSAVQRARMGTWLRLRSEGNWIWLALACGVAVSLVGASLMPGTLWRPEDPHPYDSLIYHLQVPREWFEAGRIAALHHNVFSFFPFNIEVHYLLADYLRGGPWAAAYQAQFLSLSLTLLTALTLWGWARVRAGRRAAALTAAAFVTLPWVLMLSCVSYVESGMLLFGTLAICWFFTAITGGQTAKRAFLLAGVFAGLACGAKLTNVPLLLVAMPVAGIIAWWVGRDRILSGGQMLRGCGLVVLCGLLTLSPWLIRNAVWAGNPVFPVAMRQLGQAHFTDTQVERFERAHRPAPDHAPWPSRLARAGSEIALNRQYGYVVVPLALLVAMLRWRSVEARAALLLIAMILVFWLTSTHLMGRFFVLAVVPAAMMLALLPRLTMGIMAVIVVGAATVSFTGLGPLLHEASGTRTIQSTLANYAAMGRQGLFGFEDFAALDETELHRILDGDREVVFVGDAQMFLRQAPMARLRYSTVFDLNTDSGRTWIDASYGPAPATCPSSAAIVIDAAECRRLHGTYYGVPEFSMPPQGEFKRTLVLQP